MYVLAVLRHGLVLLAPLAVACTVYLYLYPLFSGCAFPLPSRNPTEAFEQTKSLHWPFSEFSDSSLPTERAPFRLLAFGDPQLEGDTSIMTAQFGYLPRLRNIYRQITFQTEHWSLKERIRWTMHDVVDLFFDDMPNIIESFRKRFDLFGNDFYLAHIYRTLHWWTKPTHVTVLGDLLGSQWIEDDEFERRGWRFWNRTFKGSERLPNELAQYPEFSYRISGMLDGSEKEEVWARRMLNVAGNHDVGYAGDMTEERLERFERVFGNASYELHFQLPVDEEAAREAIYDKTTNPDSDRVMPEIRIIVFNDMNLDTPAKSQALQDATYTFINDAITTSTDVAKKGHFTLVLTHIPLYKPAGICVDYPFFDFHGDEDGNGLKEQYLLSADASRGFLEGLFGLSGDPGAAGGGLGRQGLVLNGHDHEGCDTFHFINQTNGTEPSERSFEVMKWLDAGFNGLRNKDGHPGRREITVRSMMGDFGGNAGMLSLWFDKESWEWQYEYSECPLGRQHFWWLTHILIFGTLLCIILYIVASISAAAGVDVDAVVTHRISMARALAVQAMSKVRRGDGKKETGKAGKAMANGNGKSQVTA